MALRKVGSRPIIVDGVTYRWRIAPRPNPNEFDYGNSMVASVQHAESLGQVLFVRCGLRHGNILGTPGVRVTPRRIAATIRAAVADGWTPTVSGDARRIDLVEISEPEAT
jgi:hypothetical protein